MDNLQYCSGLDSSGKMTNGFKPYYKWITFNTIKELLDNAKHKSFKPYYKWITFNTKWC